jgi:hypothetical protein
VNPESNEATDKPVLNVESFQRLLAAAYLLQGCSDQTSEQPVSAGRTNPCIAESMVQRQSLSLLFQEPRLQAGKGDVVCSTSPDTIDHPRGPQLSEMVPAVPEVPVGSEAAKKGLQSGSLAPRTGPTALQRMNRLLRRPTSWRAVEAFAIAIVFCSMMIASIHRLAAFPDRLSLSQEKPEKRNAFDPTFTAKARPIVKDSRQSANGDEGDLIAKDIVIRYEFVDYRGQAANKPRAVQAPPLPEKKMSAKPRVRLPSSPDADMLVASKVIQYGDDVTTWSASRTKRTAVDRPKH